jgi:hypothetical protein
MPSYRCPGAAESTSKPVKPFVVSHAHKAGRSPDVYLDKAVRSLREVCVAPAACAPPPQCLRQSDPTAMKQLPLGTGTVVCCCTTLQHTWCLELWCANTPPHYALQQQQ